MPKIENTTFLEGRVHLRAGDCLDRIRQLRAESIDSVVTDPPYALVSVVKRFGKAGSAPCIVPEGGSGAYARASSGFMGKTWDTGDRAFSVEFWAEVYRVLKPGGHILAFGGTRTVHRLTCAIEDAGFEIRDMVAWLYGSGFPKSHNLDGEWQGWGTALKPALEPITVARKPLIGTMVANVAVHGVGALNIDGCRVPFSGAADEKESKTKNQHGAFGSGPMTNQVYGKFTKDREDYNPPGRWPANVIHDGSDEVVSAFPNSSVTGVRKIPDRVQQEIGATPFTRGKDAPEYTDSGSAARYFYSAKAGSVDRAGSKHPTVKPINLLRYLVRLVTPPGGTVLDPFAGTGTTGEAAIREGCYALLMEREDEYRADIARRMALISAGPEERKRVIAEVKAKHGELAGTMFAAAEDEV